MLSETHIQDSLRLAAPGQGFMLFRNNVGVLLDARGRPVRFGLANDSSAVNARYKSADLIGWHTITITPDMIGQTIAQFVSRECKPEGWRYTGRGHESAQKSWADLVNAAGGDACFACVPHQLINKA